MEIISQHPENRLYHVPSGKAIENGPVKIVSPTIETCDLILSPTIKNCDFPLLCRHLPEGTPIIMGSTPLYLVGGLEHFLFFHILGMSSSQLTNIFQRGGSTTNQLFCLLVEKALSIRLRDDLSIEHQDV